MISQLISTAALVLMATGAIWILVLFIRTHVRSSQGTLFKELGLGRADRKLLCQLAHTLGEPDPLPLLIGRGCFENAVAAAELDEPSMVRVEELRRRLFSNP